MRSELLSTARPSPLRLAGFAAAVFGAALVGIGTSRPWVTTGFPADEAGAADVPVHGTDVWEGKVLLGAAIAALLVIIAVRLARTTAVRRTLAVVVIGFGLASIALPVADAVRAEDRFGGTAGADRMAERLAADLLLPEDVVRDQLAEQLARSLRIEVGPGLWLTATGGALLAAGGVLSLLWTGRRTSTDAPI